MNFELNPEQYRRIKRWEKMMIIFFSVAMVLIAITFFSSALLRFSEKTNNLIFAALILFVAFPAAVLQFSEKCPSCGYRLGFQTRLVLPKECKKCSVSYEKPVDQT